MSFYDVKDWIYDVKDRIMGNKTRTIAAIAAALFAEQCVLPVPNTHMDRVMAKNVWCDGPATRRDGSTQMHRLRAYQDSGVDRWDTSYSSLTTPDELDHVFRVSGVGDIIQLGSTDDGGLLELRVVDSRPQDGSLGPNKNGTESMLRLGCPGYIKVDAYFNGNLIEGGQGIEMVYAMKAWTSGGLFDGLPDYSLEDVLDMTSLSGKEQKATLASAMTAAQKQSEREYRERLKREEEIATKAYNAMLIADPERAAKVNGCKTRFGRNNDLTITYTVRSGDTILGIRQKLNDCNDEHAFFPDSLSFGASSWGSRNKVLDKQTGEPLKNETIYPGQQLILHPTYGRRELIAEYLPK